MPVETGIIVDDGVRRVTSGQRPVGRGSDMFATARRSRLLQLPGALMTASIDCS